MIIGSHVAINWKGLGMRLLIILFILLGCSGTLKPTNVPTVPNAPNVLIAPPNQIFIQNMDLLHQSLQDNTIAFIKLEKSDTPSGKTAEPYCAGVWVSPDEILSAFHCMESGDTPVEFLIGKQVAYAVREQVDPDGGLTYHFGNVTFIDDKHDLVLIQITENLQHSVAGLANWLPSIGETVYMVGHPATLYWSFAQGEISAYRFTQHLGDVIQVNIPIWFGNSGGGLFDDRGKLIGICTRKLEMPSAGYFVRLDNIKKFIDEAHMIRAAKAQRQLEKTP